MISGWCFQRNCCNVLVRSSFKVIRLEFTPPRSCEPSGFGCFSLIRTYLAKA